MKDFKNAIVRFFLHLFFSMIMLGVAAVIVQLYRHGSSAAFQLGTALLMGMPFMLWAGFVKISRYKNGGEK